MSGKNSSNWFLRPRVSADAKIRLFCFPYAGGAAHIFNQWANFLPSEIELCAVQLPGRGSRINEVPLKEVSEAAAVIASEAAKLGDRTFAFFGHSLGATIAFETARYLKKQSRALPVHLFVSGRSAPQTLPETEKFYRFSDDRFIENVKKLGGTPPELFASRELTELILPSLRADFQMVQEYSFQPGEKLLCPISAFGGTTDAFVSRESVLAWSEQTSGSFAAHFLDGDHFFISSQGKEIVSIVAEALKPNSQLDFL